MKRLARERDGGEIVSGRKEFGNLSTIPPDFKRFLCGNALARVRPFLLDEIAKHKLKFRSVRDSCQKFASCIEFETTMFRVVDK